MPTLAEVRLTAHLSQAALAARSGVSPATIQRIERGRTRPCPRVVARLSVALGVSAETIVEFRSVARRTQLPPPAIRSAPWHVLVVDASPLLLASLRDLLEGEGYQVSTQPALDLNLDAITRLAPNLILLDDLGAKEEMGWSLLRRLRADPRTTTTPLILCSCAGCDADEVERRLAEPGLWVVSRPFDLDALLGAVRAALSPPLVTV